jgi:hypothetical protein
VLRIQQLLEGGRHFQPSLLVDLCWMISAKHRFASLPSTADFASSAVTASLPFTAVLWLARLVPQPDWRRILWTEEENRLNFV